jgi:protein gp37
MAQNSKIEWCHHTANLWWGCTSVHSGCDNCYAEVLSKRFGDNVWGNNSPRKQIKSFWKDLNKYQNIAKSKNEVHKVFIGSMMDIFEKPMPLIDSKGDLLPIDTGQVRERLFSLITSNCYPNLMFLFLTKRPSNINKYIPLSWKENPPKNVMFGTSPVNQETADKLIPQLLEVKGKRFLSIEPQLGEIDLLKRPLGEDINSVFNKEFYRYIDCVNWVIQGGESGNYKRPFNLEWAYSMKKQCKISNVPYFFKQIDKIKEIPNDLIIREFPDLNII